MLFLVKIISTTCIIALVSELAKRTEKLGAFIGALPLVSILIIFWIFLETGDVEKVGNYSMYAFWYVLASLPVFLFVPYVLKRGVNFYLTMGCSVLVAAICLLFAALAAKRFGVHLLP